MRAAWYGLGLLAGLACGRALADPTEDLLRELTRCERSLDRESDVGYARIAERCPALAERLAASRWASVLPVGWRVADNELSAAGLAELATLIARERAGDPAAPGPSPALLAPVLRELGAGAGERSGAWTRLRRWLRSLFETREENPAGGWLPRLLRRLDPGDAVLRLFGYGVLAAVVALALAIVANELRSAGVLRRRGAGAAGAVVPAADCAAQPQAADAGPAGARERVAVLLRIVTEALTRAQRLPPAGSLTVRELVQAARIDSQAERARLRELAVVAERARFAPRAPPPGELESALSSGAVLLAWLERDGAS